MENNTFACDINTYMAVTIQPPAYTDIQYTCLVFYSDFRDTVHAVDHRHRERDICTENYRRLLRAFVFLVERRHTRHEVLCIPGAWREGSHLAEDQTSDWWRAGGCLCVCAQALVHNRLCCSEHARVTIKLIAFCVLIEKMLIDKSVAFISWLTAGFSNGTVSSNCVLSLIFNGQ